MSLIDKLKTGQTGKRKVLAGIVAGAITIGLAVGCSRDSKEYVSDSITSTSVYPQSDNQEDKYSYKRFLEVLGKERVEGMIDKEKLDLKENWFENEDFTKKDREELFNIYTNPEKIREKFSEKEKVEYDSFNPGDLSDSELKKYRERIPWLVPESKKFVEGDKMSIFIGKSVEEMHISPGFW